MQIGTKINNTNSSPSPPTKTFKKLNYDDPGIRSVRYRNEKLLMPVPVCTETLDLNRYRNAPLPDWDDRCQNFNVVVYRTTQFFYLAGKIVFTAPFNRAPIIIIFLFS